MRRASLQYRRFNRVFGAGVNYRAVKRIAGRQRYKAKKLAAYLHIKQNTYSQYENGQRQLFIDVLCRLADFYGVTTDYILERTSIKSPTKQ